LTRPPTRLWFCRAVDLHCFALINDPVGGRCLDRADEMVAAGKPLKWRWDLAKARERTREEAAGPPGQDEAEPVTGERGRRTRPRRQRVCLCLRWCVPLVIPAEARRSVPPAERPEGTRPRLELDELSLRSEALPGVRGFHLSPPSRVKQAKLLPHRAASVRSASTTWGSPADEGVGGQVRPRDCDRLPSPGRPPVPDHRNDGLDPPGRGTAQAPGLNWLALAGEWKAHGARTARHPYGRFRRCATRDVASAVAALSDAAWRALNTGSGRRGAVAFRSPGVNGGRWRSAFPQVRTDFHESGQVRKPRSTLLRHLALRVAAVFTAFGIRDGTQKTPGRRGIEPRQPGVVCLGPPPPASGLPE
jgi:hypothetical protein